MVVKNKDNSVRNMGCSNNFFCLYLFRCLGSKLQGSEDPRIQGFEGQMPEVSPKNPTVNFF